MKIEKAIEIKFQWRKDNYPPPLADEMNADMLSIEALHRVIDLRTKPHYRAEAPLPGEDKE